MGKTAPSKPPETKLGQAKALIDVGRQAALQWWTDDAITLAAALAFYTTFSLAPLLVIALAIAGTFMGEEAARGELTHQMGTLIGQSGAEFLEKTVTNAAAEKHSGRVATIFSIVTLIIGSTGVFVQLQSTLNTMWGVKADPNSRRSTVWEFLRVRLLSFGLVVAVGFLLLVSLIVATLLQVLHNYLMARMMEPAWIWDFINFLVSLSVITLLFAMIFKFLPDVQLAWSDVIVGATVTAAIFGLGKFLIGFYIGNSAVAGTYGAAGSLIVILLWVWFSGCILYYGAEFTQIYSRNFGSRFVPVEFAEQVDPARTEPDAEVSKED